MAGLGAGDQRSGIEGWLGFFAVYLGDVGHTSDSDLGQQDLVFELGLDSQHLQVQPLDSCEVLSAVELAALPVQ